MSPGTCAAIFLLFVLSTTCEGKYVDQLTRDEYDYIVVGGGSSGSVLASRLSEDEKTTVLLLEAGKAPHQHSEVPLFAVDLLQDPEMTWPYFLEPQEKAFLNLEGERMFLPRGKALGGTSSINYMVYIRGNKRDYDEWQRMGAEGWDYDSVLPYFLKSEDQTDPNLAESAYHAKGGPLTVSTVSYSTPLREAYLKTVESLGHQVRDVNGESQLGFNPIQFNTRDGLRCGTEKAFLRPAANRDNLDVVTEAYVTKVKLDDKKKVIGVQFEHHNRSRSIAVRKEVILSAGAIATPKILMLSGIGPAQHLQELGIPVVVDLPVGENLQDHVAAPGFPYLLNSSVSIVNSRIINKNTIGELLSGTGPLTLPSKLEVLGFIKSKYQEVENWPDLEIFFISGLLVPFGDKPGNVNGEDDMITAVAILLRPKSRGTVRLRSADPQEQPIIDPKYLTEEDDVKILAEGVRFLDQAFSSAPLQQFNPVRVPEEILGCEGMESGSEEQLNCVTRRYTILAHHPTSTCKMGSPTDPTTVVDPRLRVKGVSGLRVADGSVMPQVVSGNTNAACIMIGEKAADMILGRV